MSKISWASLINETNLGEIAGRFFSCSGPLLENTMKSSINLCVNSEHAAFVGLQGNV